MIHVGLCLILKVRKQNLREPKWLVLELGPDPSSLASRAL